MCRGGLQQKNTHFLCKKCGFELYKNPKPATLNILQNQKGEILLAKRKTNPKAGFWDIPGGFMDPGETAEQCAIRETQEELNITIKSFAFLDSYHGTYFYQNVVYPVIDLAFFARITPHQEKSFVVSDELAGVRFFSRTAIPYNRICTERAKKALRDFFNRQPL